MQDRLTVRHFTFWISYSLRLLLSPKFGQTAEVRS